MKAAALLLLLLVPGCSTTQRDSSMTVQRWVCVGVCVYERRMLTIADDEVQQHSQ